MSQTRMHSFIEAWANIVIGFTINFVANLMILPIFGFNVRAGQAFGIGLIFTVISLVRSYVLRRWQWLRGHMKKFWTAAAPERPDGSFKSRRELDLAVDAAMYGIKPRETPPPTNSLREKP